MKSRIQVYEKALPQAVARDFEFAKTYTSQITQEWPDVRGEGSFRLQPNVGYGQSPAILSTPRTVAREDSESNTLYETALDEALRLMIQEAEADRETLSIEILGDIHVVRRNPSLIEKEGLNIWYDKGYPRFSSGKYQGMLDLTIQGIGYKRRSASS